ncbi:MAG: response regulator [Pricia sp.]|nr:response regulator [Pricia sp.]
MTTQSKRNLKVLLVEDDPIFVLLAQIKLKQLGIEAVLSVENGLCALNYLQVNTPDLIFLDINMPTMDGFEFLNAIEHYDMCPATPIVMLTSAGSTRDRQWAMHYRNVIDYIEKPLTIPKIEALLGKLNLTSTV